MRQVFRRSSPEVASTSEVFLGKGAAGLALQISLERDSLGLVSECHCRLNPPWEELRCMWHLAGIVNFEAFWKILSHPHIPMARWLDALECVDIPEIPVHMRPSYESLLAIYSELRGLAKSLTRAITSNYNRA